MIKYLLFFTLISITVTLNTVAQTLLKLGAKPNLFNLYLLAGILAYGLSAIFYILVLSKVNLSVAYPVVIGLTIVATTFSGALYFREHISMTHWLGIGLMLSGISAIAFEKIS